MSQDPYYSWLKEFYQDVDNLLEAPLEKTPAPPPAPLSPQAAAGGKQEATQREISSLRSEIGSIKQQGEVARYQELLEKFQKLAEERARLEDELDILHQENAQRRAWQESIQKELAGLREKASIAQEGYEAHIRRLEEQIRAFAQEKAQLQGAVEELRKQSRNP